MDIKMDVIKEINQLHRRISLLENCFAVPCTTSITKNGDIIKDKYVLGAKNGAPVINAFTPISKAQAHVGNFSWIPTLPDLFNAGDTFRADSGDNEIVG